MKIIFTLLFSIYFCGLADADNLSKEIKAWKLGREVPHKLLSFPSGKVSKKDDLDFGIGEYLRSVRSYIDQIENDELTEEIVFDSRSDSASLQAALMRLGERKGLKWVAQKLDERKSLRWEIQTLKQALQSPFSRLEVAFIEKKEMQKTRAVDELTDLKVALDSGVDWKIAYAKTANENPDVERRKREPKVQTTLVGYLFSGWISGTGFSFSTLGLNENLPLQHLKHVVGSSRGGYILETEEGVYLYYIFDTWTPNV
ncbi:hypothetical protein [Undibacterium sp. CY21W]|uniref:hypothetical protein n=1 Tax=Undibacterium sp. CY21W TaxID=2762293 RepID=UPI00164A31F5|nr:hypothetical protein [Undibacterium sp. CY21W]MBC3928943.1 hypothetical protein [Undibacterium sp. CY21W]